MSEKSYVIYEIPSKETIYELLDSEEKREKGKKDYFKK